jgi:hypothetical protein
LNDIKKFMMVRNENTSPSRWDDARVPETQKSPEEMERFCSLGFLDSRLRPAADGFDPSPQQEGYTVLSSRCGYEPSTSHVSLIFIAHLAYPNEFKGYRTWISVFSCHSPESTII